MEENEQKDIWLQKNVIKGKEVRINILRKLKFWNRIWMCSILLGISHKVQYEMAFMMEAWGIIEEIR